MLRENAGLLRRLQEWEVMAETSLRPYLERVATLDLLGLHEGLARVASLALQHGVPHQRVLDAVKPDPRGGTATTAT